MQPRDSQIQRLGYEGPTTQAYAQQFRLPQLMAPEFDDTSQIENRSSREAEDSVPRVMESPQKTQIQGTQARVQRSRQGFQPQTSHHAIQRIPDSSRSQHDKRVRLTQAQPKDFGPRDVPPVTLRNSPGFIEPQPNIQNDLSRQQSNRSPSRVPGNRIAFQSQPTSAPRGRTTQPMGATSHGPQNPLTTQPMVSGNSTGDGSNLSLKGSDFGYRSEDFQVPDRPSKVDPKYDFLFTDIDRHSDAVVNIDPNDPASRPISLAEVIFHTLQNNPHILVAQFRPSNDAFNQEIVRSEFDPVFKLGGQWGRADTLVGSVLDGQGVGTGSIANDQFTRPSGLTDNISLSQKLSTGGVADIGWSTEYKFAQPAGSFLTLNPQQSSSLNIRINHPLFQGAGNRFNSLRIEIAMVDYHGSLWDFEAKVNSIIKNVVLDYWELYAAYSDVRKYVAEVKDSKTTWRKEIEKKNLGASSLPDVAQAAENYEFQSYALASSRRRFVTYELRLRERMGLPPKDGKTLVPITVPVTELQVPDWDEALATAMRTRPEILAQQKLVEVKELEYELKENAFLPDIEGYATYSLNGLGTNFHDSAGGVLDNEHTSWTLGFKYERPFYKRKAEAELDQKLVELLQEKAVLKQIEFSITHELRSTYAEIKTARDMFEALDRRLRAAEVRKEVSRVLYDQGKMSLDLFLRIQSAYIHTTLDRDEAYIKFNQALSNWEYAKGTILHNADIHIRKEDGVPEWCNRY